MSLCKVHAKLCATPSKLKLGHRFSPSYLLVFVVCKPACKISVLGFQDARPYAGALQPPVEPKRFGSQLPRQLTYKVLEAHAVFDLFKTDEDGNGFLFPPTKQFPRGNFRVI